MSWNRFYEIIDRNFISILSKEYRCVSPTFYNRTIKCYQGEVIQRKGIVFIKVEIENQEIKKIYVGGEAVVVFSSQININS